MLSRMDRDDLLTLHQAAREFHVPVPWLKRRAAGGTVPCLRAGRRMIFSRLGLRNALIRLAREGEVHSDSEDGDATS